MVMSNMPEGLTEDEQKKWAGAEKVSSSGTWPMCDPRPRLQEVAALRAEVERQKWWVDVANEECGKLKDESETMKQAAHQAILAAEDIVEMADAFISTKDLKSLRNYAGNISSILRRAQPKETEDD